MAFTFRPAVRKGIHLLIGIAGGTGAGKTWSAMLLAKGLAGGKRFAVIDTENGRAEMYADFFQFDVLDIAPPFAPSTYEGALDAAVKAKYPVIVVDQISHEWAGEGGCLTMQEDDLQESVERALKRPGERREDWQIAEANKMRSWIRPKREHKAMVNKLLQLDAHVILLFRAESKIEMVRDEKGKTVIQEKKSLVGLNGWIPISEKGLPFELTASFLMVADRPGVPMPIKLQEQHKAFFPADKPITEAAGAQLGAWALGATTSTAVSRGTGGGDVSSTTKTIETQSPAAVETIDRNTARKLFELFLGELSAPLKAKAQDLLIAWLKKTYGIDALSSLRKAGIADVQAAAIDHARDLSIANAQ